MKIENKSFFSKMSLKNFKKLEVSLIINYFSLLKTPYNCKKQGLFQI